MVYLGLFEALFFLCILIFSCTIVFIMQKEIYPPGKKMAESFLLGVHAGFIVVVLVLMLVLMLMTTKMFFKSAEIFV